MNYIFLIKIYNEIYIFWSYSNQKDRFWFIILLLVLLVYTLLLGSVGSNLTSYIWFLLKFTLLFLIHMTLLWQDICIQCYLNVSWTITYLFIRLYLSFTCLLKVSSRAVIPNPDHSGSNACRALTDCATTAISKTRYWLSVYEHIHSFWDWNNT